VPKRDYFIHATSKLDKKIRITREYWNYIARKKHPEVKGKKQQAVETLLNPDIIKRSSADDKVFLYYLKLQDRYLCIVIKNLNGQGFIITAYITKKLAKGELIYEKVAKN